MLKRNNFSIVKQLLKKKSIVFEKQRLILHESRFVLHNISRFSYIVRVSLQLIHIIDSLLQYKFYTTCLIFEHESRFYLFFFKNFIFESMIAIYFCKKQCDYANRLRCIRYIECAIRCEFRSEHVFI